MKAIDMKTAVLSLIATSAFCSISVGADPAWFEKRDHPVDTYIASINNIIKAEHQARRPIPGYSNNDTLPMFVFPKFIRYSEKMDFRLNVSGVQRLYLGSPDHMSISSIRLDKGDGKELTIKNNDNKLIVGTKEEGKNKVRWHGRDRMDINGGELTLELNRQYKWISGKVDIRAIAWIDKSSHHDKWTEAKRNRENANNMARFRSRFLVPSGYTPLDLGKMISITTNQIRERQKRENIDSAITDRIIETLNNSKSGADYAKALEMIPAMDRFRNFKHLRDRVAHAKDVPGLLKKFDATVKRDYYQLDPGKFDYNRGVQNLEREWNSLIERTSRISAYHAEISKSIETMLKKERDAEAAKKELERLSAKLTAASGNLDNYQAVQKELEAFHLSLYGDMKEIDFDAILINRNPPTRYSHNGDQHLGRHSRIGKGLGILTGWKEGKPVVKNILEGKMPPGAYRNPDLSYDGKRVVFAFCDHTEKSAGLRRFFIYEAAIDGSWVRQLTGTKRDKLATWDNRATVLIEDNDPCYLPDGGIIFISSRCQSFGRCHGGRYNPAWTLHRCDKDGNNIKQLSFGNENEVEPSVLNDGRIVFTRWEYTNRHEMWFHKLWWCRPDGTAITHFFGNDMIVPHQFVETSAIPGTHKVVATGQGHHSFNTGTTVVIDTNIDENGEHAIEHITPETPYSETKGWPSPHYSHPYAITEKLFLVSRADHPVSPQGRTPPAAGRAIYLVDSAGGRIKLYEDPEVASVSPIAIRKRNVPPAIPSMVKEDAEPYGTLFLQNAYLTRNDPEGIIKPGMIKAIRVNALGVQPRARRTSLSKYVGVEIPKSVLGTVPVNEDGSAAFRVPANTALQLQTLDENGMAILTEKSFFYMQPGETRSCIGCHEPVGTAPDMKKMAKMSRVKPMNLKPAAGPQYKGGMSFHRTVQPVLDKHCIKCHGLEKTEGKVNLVLASPGKGFPESFNQLVSRGNFRLGDKGYMGGRYKGTNLTYNISRPRKFYAYESKLAHKLAEGDKHHKSLKDTDRESYMRVIEWMDLNAQCFGDLFPNKIEERGINNAGVNPLQTYVKELFGDTIAKQPIGALINFVQPDESRILMMPLPENKGGWGQIKGYSSKTDDKYKKMAELIEACIKRHPNENTNGWQPTWAMGGGEDWVISARTNYLQRVKQASSVVKEKKR